MYDESTDDYKFDTFKALTRTKQVMFKEIPEANYSRFGLIIISVLIGNSELPYQNYRCNIDQIVV